MSLIELLIALVVICLVWWAANALMGAFGIGDPIRTVVIVVLVIVPVLYVLSLVGGPNVLNLRL